MFKKTRCKNQIKKNICEINGLGLNGYKYKKNITLNAGNSGTLARLIMGLLIHTKKEIKLVGDKSHLKRFLSNNPPLKNL